MGNIAKHLIGASRDHGSDAAELTVTEVGLGSILK